MTTIVRVEDGFAANEWVCENLSYTQSICASASTALCTLCVHDVVYGGEDHQEPSHEDNDAHIYHRKQTRNIREEPSLAKSDVGTNAAPWHDCLSFWVIY